MHMDYYFEFSDITNFKCVLKSDINIVFPVFKFIFIMSYLKIISIFKNLKFKMNYIF